MLKKRQIIWGTECGTFKINIMSVDVDIYMNNLKKFFRENPKELYNLVPKGKEEEFYIKIRSTAESNLHNGDEVSLTQKQLIQICAEINNKKIFQKSITNGVMVQTAFGFYSLN